MICYEQNYRVPDQQSDQFCAWLEEKVQDYLQIKGFVSADVFQANPENQKDDDGRHSYWTIHFQIKDVESYQSFAKEFLKALSQELEMEFRASPATHSRVLHLVRGF